MKTNTNQIEVKDATNAIIHPSETKKKQAPSVSYAIQSFANNNKKLLEAKMISEEDFATLTAIKNRAKDKYVNSTFGD